MSGPAALAGFAEVRRWYMPMAFWFWNDRLEEAEVRRQVHLMSEANIGGFFIHARMGRVTPYLSEPWLEAVGAAVDEAARRGMYVWLYDEDNWPSGYAGGRVLQLGEWTLQRYARAEVLSAEPGRPVQPSTFDGVLCAFAIHGRGAGARILERLAADRRQRVTPRHTEADGVLVFHRELHRGERRFCPEETTRGYVDVFNPAVTDAFIESTYALYHRRFARHFGTTIAGFFFDEPQYHELGLWGDAAARFPWSESFPRIYRRLHGRDLLWDLPQLLWEIGDFQAARYRYYRLLSERFAACFTSRLAGWCRDHGVLLTGHVLLEEYPRQAARCSGDPLAHYAASQIPGIDHLGKDLELKAYWSSTRVLCKQAQSAAHQLGKERTLCETFAGASHYFGLPDQKWMGDWLMALGVNLLCSHAFHYSLRGYRKRDYPPTLGVQQPWFPFSAPLGAHFARLSWALSRGRRVVHVLLLHPIESFWATQSDANFEGRDDPLSLSLKTVSGLLTHSGFDWDFGSEDYLERWGRVEGNRLRLGAGDYAVVVVPPVVRLRAGTQELIARFLQGGGAVLAVGSAPLPGLPEPRIRIGEWDDPRLMEKLLEALRRILPPQLELDETGAGFGRPAGGIGDLVFQERRLAGLELFFIASGGKTPRRVRCRFRCPGHPLAFDTFTGRMRRLPFERDGEGTVLELEVGGSSSRLIAFSGDTPGDATRASRVSRARPEPPGIRLFTAEAGVPVTIHDPNVLILDRLDLRIGEEWHRGMQALAAAAELAGAGGGRPLRAVFPFDSAVDLSGAFLLCETPELFRIFLDDRPIPVAGGRWHLEASLRMLELPPIAAGRHSIVLEAGAGRPLELEPLYLAGDFGVSLTGTEARIITPPAALRAGSWTDQGLPFYAGRVTYRIAFTLPGRPAEARLRFTGEREKDARVVRLNGREAATLVASPFEAEVAACLRPGQNRLEVTVANHLRNFYGPHHCGGEDDVDCFSPDDFFRRETFTARYLLKPSGILGDVLLFAEVES